MLTRLSPLLAPLVDNHRRSVPDFNKYMMTNFVDNKYSRCYFSIVRSARARIYTGYTERHHVVPKSLGGSNDPENIVLLTAREHFVCHLLLPKFTVGDDRKKMVYARWLLCTKAGRKERDYQVSSRAFATAREEWALSHDFGSGMRGKRHNENTKSKISEAVTGEKNGKFGMRWAKPSNRAKQSSTEHRQKLSQAKIGKPRSEEAKAKIREGWAKRKALLHSLCAG